MRQAGNADGSISQSFVWPVSFMRKNRLQLISDFPIRRLTQRAPQVAIRMTDATDFGGVRSFSSPLLKAKIPTWLRNMPMTVYSRSGAG